MQNYLYDPRGTTDNLVGKMATRVPKLNGLRLGVLNNTKWNAAKLLQEIVSSLKAEITFSEINYFKKETYTRAAESTLIERIAAHNDIALIAIAD